ncbi:MAG TPA: substrate-binding domain-containing protein, partial [Coriobacteriia bacterium]|nr:substrate-binding domain-containing protein [Coriobacteriia bacterium]
MKISTKQAAITAAGLALATGILAGCSNGATTPSGAGSTSGTTAAKVGLLLPDTLSPRYESADKPYFEAKLKELDPNATVLYANANADASKQLQQAESMISQGVKVLVISSVDGEAAASIVVEAQAKNIPVIAYDRLIDSPKLDYYI